MFSPAKAPRAQRKFILYFSELGVLCVFAGGIFFQLWNSKQPRFKISWLDFESYDFRLNSNLERLDSYNEGPENPSLRIRQK
jgi:hypothetical protein